MSRLIRSAALACAALLAVFSAAPRAQAQGGGFAAFARLIRPYHQVALVQVPEVETELKLTAEQKTKAVQLFEDFNADRGALWQEAAGDFDSIREDMEKLTADTAKQLNDALDDAQKKRLAEVYVQANGATALFDSSIATGLKLTDEQKQKLNDVRTESRGAFQGGVDWQNLEEEEAIAEADKLIAEQDTKYLAVLTDEQKAEFEKLKGEKLEIDLAGLPNPFGG